MEGMYEYVIGLEVHIKLATATKIFCRCVNEQNFEHLAANTHICPVCTGQPGALPLLSHEVVQKAIALGLLLGCKINEVSGFERKSYFYPDLPMGYQITQLTKALNTDGEMSFYLADLETEKKIRIQQAHLECDAGKTIHQNGAGVVDFNRAGTPLIEIVTMPDFTSDEEVGEFLKELQRTLRYNGISDADMEKGQMRCDVNISVRKKGDSKLGTKVEVKNMNSFSAIKRAIAYEFARHSELLDAGKTIDQETRGWDDTAKNSYSMRSKADAVDYRYFPEPDLPKLHIDQQMIDTARGTISGSTAAKITSYKEKYGFNKEFINGLIGYKQINALFEELVAEGFDAKLVAKYIVGFVLKSASEGDLSGFDRPEFTVFLQYVTDKKLSDQQAKIVMNERLATGGTIDALIEAKGFHDTGEAIDLESITDELLKNNQNVVDEYKKGKLTAIGFLVGQAMKATGGKSSPQEIKEIFERKLS